MLRIALVLPLALAAGCDLVPATNEFDPESTSLRPGIVTGGIRAVFAPTIPGDPSQDAPAAAGACARSDGDHSGFEVVLRGITDDGGDPINAFSAETNSSGDFRFEDVPPGAYTIAFIRDGFEVPPVAEVTIGIGEERALGSFCALNTTPPAPPTLLPLPAVVRQDATPPAIEIVVDACDPAAAGCAVAFEVVQLVGDAATTTLLPPDAARVDLTMGDGSGARTTVTVDVVGVDAMGNRSAATRAVVVVDGTPPAAPVALTASTGRDRLTMGWRPGVPDEGDDAPASYLVWYGLVPREPSAACPFGVPTFDAAGDIVDENGQPAFALEGAAPLSTGELVLTLSGIAAGTDVVLHVAALDAAGNAGCYSAPLVARPDDVGFAPTTSQPLAVAGARRVVAGSDPRDGTVVMARGGAGLAFQSGGAVDVDATPANDVDVDGDVVYAAAGALGVRVVELGAGGAPDLDGATTLSTGDDVRAVLALPGRLAIGSDRAVRVIDPAAPPSTAAAADGDGVVVALRAFSDLIVAVRGPGGDQVRVGALGRGDLVVRGESALLAGTPTDVLVHDDALWLAFSNAERASVVALELAGCLEGRDTCLTVRGRRQLPVQPGASSVARLAGLDDRVVVAVDNAGRTELLALATDAGLAIVGRASLGDGAPRALFTVDGGVCAGVADSAGDTLRCASTVGALVVDDERRGVTTRAVLRVRAAGAHVYALENGGADEPSSLARLRLSDLDTPERIDVPPDALDRVVQLVGGTVLQDGSLLAVDGFARVWVLRPGATALRLAGDLAASLASLAPSLGDATDLDFTGYTGFVERRGSALVLGLAGEAPRALVARVSLRLGADGEVAVDAPAVGDVVVVDDVRRYTKLILRDGRALLPTVPFGVVAVTLGETLAVDASSSVPRSADQTTELNDLVVASIDGAPGLIGVGTRPVDGGTAPGLVSIAGAVVTPLQSPAAFVAGATSMCGLQGALVVGTVRQGVVLLREEAPGRFTAVSAVPSATQVVEPVPSARGVLIADGAGGTVYAVLR